MGALCVAVLQESEKISVSSDVKKAGACRTIELVENSDEILNGDLGIVISSK